MGQKTHPKGFRLISTQSYISNWYALKFSYLTLCAEDYFIRSTILFNLKNYLTLADINIDRIINKQNSKEYIKVKINALYPKIQTSALKIFEYFLKIQYSLNLNKIENLNLILDKKKYFKTNFQNYKLKNNEIKVYYQLIIIHIIKNLLRLFQKKTNKNYFINFTLFTNPFENINLIAKYICEQLEQRISCKKIIKDTINFINYLNLNIKGIKIQISGRLNGNNIANIEWEKENSMPLHTIFANISYAQQIAQTKYGILGVKVWIYSKD